MSFLSDIWSSLLGAFASALEFLDQLVEPLFGVHSWGWAIIALTLLVRTAMLPLAIRQTKSMRGMQTIQPKVKEIQKKYKVDRDLMKKDPELYRKKKAQQNEELMKLYQEEGVNPASSCLPLLLQMPIFFALFRILGAGDDGVPELVEAPFYFFTSFISEGAEAGGLGVSLSQAGWPGFLLILLMVGSMFITQRQMMARNAAEGPAATQQKVMMYVFPVFLAVISWNFPMAVVLYWVTTNIWQGVQQYIIFKTVTDDDTPPAKGSSGGGGAGAAKGKGSGATDQKAKGRKDGKDAEDSDASWPGKADAGSNGSSNGSSTPKASGSSGNGAKSAGGKKKRSSEHLPKRRS